MRGTQPGYTMGRWRPRPRAGATFMADDEVVPWTARFAMGARGGLIVELIEPIDGEVGFYRDALPGHLVSPQSTF
jgi:hypothetical protein